MSVRIEKNSGEKKTQPVNLKHSAAGHGKREAQTKVSQLLNVKVQSQQPSSTTDSSMTTNSAGIKQDSELPKDDANKPRRKEKRTLMQADDLGVNDSKKPRTSEKPHTSGQIKSKEDSVSVHEDLLSVATDPVVSDKLIDEENPCDVDSTPGVTADAVDVAADQKDDTGVENFDVISLSDVSDAIIVSDEYNEYEIEVPEQADEDFHDADSKAVTPTSPDDTVSGNVIERECEAAVRSASSSLAFLSCETGFGERPAEPLHVTEADADVLDGKDTTPLDDRCPELLKVDEISVQRGDKSHVDSETCAASELVGHENVEKTAECSDEPAGFPSANDVAASSSEFFIDLTASDESEKVPKDGKNDKGSEARNKADITEKMSTVSEEEQKCESVTEDGTEQLASTAVCSAAESSNVKEKDEPETVTQHDSEQKDSAGELIADKSEGIELAAWHKPAASSEVSAEKLTGSLTAEETACTADQLQAETVTNTEDKIQELNQSPDSPDDLTQAPASPGELKADIAHTEILKGESYDTASSVEAIMPGSPEQPLSNVDVSEHSRKTRPDCDVDTQRAAQSGYTKQSLQAQAQMKPTLKKGSTVKQSQQLEKDAALRDTRERSPGSSRTRRRRTRSPATDDNKSSTHGIHPHYKLDTNHSQQDKLKRHESQKTKKCESDFTHLGYKPPIEPEHDSYVSDLELISSDEEIVEYKDDGNHCCWFCLNMYDTIPSLLEHLQEAAHEQVVVV